ncbi:MAG TPA: electron transfer flavoprotein subunit beta/FixA family protein [Vicinamibacteria bacterium]|nr:electron transfer flavoprotein subunit beta/FixA family protein [Vicinamibacteria bacterium]
MSLKVASLMKQVPLPSEMRTGADGLMDRTTAQSTVNHDCAFALEQALEIKDSAPDCELFVVSMGPPSFEQSLRKAISMGFDRACLLSDRRLGGSDTFATGLALAAFLRKLGFEKECGEPFIVFAGRQTSDGDTAHVPSQVAEGLGIPQATFAEEITYRGDHLLVRRIVEGGHQVLRVPLPAVISVAPTARPLRRPSIKGLMRSKKAFVETWNIDQIGLRADEVGIDGSPTIVAKVVTMARTRPEAVMLSGPARESVDGLVYALERRPR